MPIQKPAILTAELCRELTPRMFVVNYAAWEDKPAPEVKTECKTGVPPHMMAKLSPAVKDLLDPVDMGSLHCWMLPKDKATSLHYHDQDEYWAWIKGRTLLTIRLPDGRSDQFEIGPGWIVHCVRGVEHGHQPLEDWGCYEWVGRARKGIRTGHLTRTF